MAKRGRIVDELWDPEPWELPVKACRKRTDRRLRELPAPKDMIPAEKMAARAILAVCRGCGRCERGM